MNRLKECAGMFLAGLKKFGWDCRNDLERIWVDFREDISDLWTDLQTDVKKLLELCREMAGALAAEVRLVVCRWIG